MQGQETTQAEGPSAASIEEHQGRSTGRKILDRAAELFVARGVAATSLREIAEGLAFTKAALYYHFPSKDRLLSALMSPLHDDIGAVLTRREDRGVPAEQRDVVLALIDARLAHPDAVRLGSDPAVRHHERLGKRAATLHERSVVALVGRTARTEERLRAVAALGALDALAVRCTPDAIEHVRSAGVAAAVGALGGAAGR